MNLLVDAPTGLQELVEVGEGGGYFDVNRVLWDEREDGPLPEITLGGMVRVGAGLVFDQARMDEHVAVLMSPARAALILRIDADVDAVVDAVIGNRAEEYRAANAAALAYQAAGYAGEVPKSVQSWATPKNWTPRQAADDILAAADRLIALRELIREKRLACKEPARTAADKVALDTVASQWAAALASIRTSAGL
jgi:hypothetical protein